MTEESVSPYEDDDLLWQCGGSAVLLKATVDPFTYACRLTSGEIVFFESATVSGDGNFVLLSGIREVSYPRSDALQLTELGEPTFDRGMEVRRDAIVWIADAPYGS